MYTVTVRQAARMIYGEDTPATIRAVQRLIASEQLKAQQVPGGAALPYLISESSINAFIKKRQSHK